MTAKPTTKIELCLNTRELPLDQLRKFAESGYLYAVVDSADVPIVPAKMQELGEDRALSLFKGTQHQDYWAVAPYLVRVDLSILRWLYERLWKEPWGIFAISDKTLVELQNHFQKFIVTRLPDGKRWMFRFYDPRVLKDFLPCCNEHELREFFAIVRGLAAASEGQGSTLWTVA